MNSFTELNNICIEKIPAVKQGSTPTAEKERIDNNPFHPSKQTGAVPVSLQYRERRMHERENALILLRFMLMRK